MGWTLTIDHVCKDEPVEGFAYEPPGEWRLTLPLSQLHIVFLKGPTRAGSSRGSS